MSTFKTSKEVIEIFPHPNPEVLALELAKVGDRQIVIQKGLYQNGDVVVFTPDKSVLTGDIRLEFEKYLTGTDKDRVKAIKLKGELSEGIIIPPHLINIDLSTVDIGEDISELLGISEFIPEIPKHLNGTLKALPINNLSKHDCEQYAVHISKFSPDQEIIITEKVHGTQLIFAHDIDNDVTIVSSKGRFKQSLVLEEDDNNFYWQAVKNSKLLELVKSNFTSGVVQMFGEGIPVQSGYTYGAKEPTVLLFKVLHNGERVPLNELPEEIRNLWVPIVYQGTIKFNDDNRTLSKELVDLRLGNELVSGKSLHIKEGVVLTTNNPFRGKDDMYLKIINPSYKDDHNAVN